MVTAPTAPAAAARLASHLLLLKIAEQVKLNIYYIYINLPLREVPRRLLKTFTSGFSLYRR